MKRKGRPPVFISRVKQGQWVKLNSFAELLTYELEEVYPRLSQKEKKEYIECRTQQLKAEEMFYLHSCAFDQGWLKFYFNLYSNFFNLSSLISVNKLKKSIWMCEERDFPICF